jgi:uncharacterized protein YlxW (UPF0749 family)
MTRPDPPRGSSGGRWMSPDFLTELFSNPLDPGYADAAARKAQRPYSGRRRSTARTVLIVVALLIGLLFAVAYRQTVADEPRRSQARAELVAQIRQRQAAADDLRSRADVLRDDVARLRDATLDRGDAERLRELEAETGFRRVTGDGAVVTVGDAPNVSEDGLTPSGKPDLGKIFDRDLQSITNALWASGAEAIAVNGQRLSSTSPIRKAGGAILVDFRPVASPYEISAIGPGDMRDRFEDTGAARLMDRLVDVEGIRFDVNDRDDLTLPAANEPSLDYARSAGGGASPFSTGATTGGPGPPERPTPSTSPTGGR